MFEIVTVIMVSSGTAIFSIMRETKRANKINSLIADMYKDDPNIVYFMGQELSRDTHEIVRTNPNFSMRELRIFNEKRESENPEVVVHERRQQR